jgi:YHS domain-containing protein
MKLYYILLLVSFSTGVFSQNKSHFNIDKNHIAVEGYDLVSYFDLNPREGNSSILYTYKGVDYYFTNTKNLNKFRRSPNKYLPQYGGWCAYAMGDSGELVEVDPETFKIINGKLYLFYNQFFTNTLKSWNKDEINLKESANMNWIQYLKTSK